MDSSIKRWHILFSGRVQGVGFRFTAQIFAQELGLTGWVRNRPDKKVEMEAQGPADRIQELIARLKSQPPIQIEDYQVTETELRSSENKFSVLPGGIFGF